MNIEALNTIDFNALAADVYGNASTHGFHDEERNLPHWLCLVICELSEAVEADRKHSRAKLDAFSRAMKEPVCPHEGYNPEQIFDYWFRTYVKDTVEDELADTVIRLLDLAAMRGADLSNLFCGTIHSWDETASFTEMFFPGQAQDPVHRTCLGKCEIWSDTASNVDSIRVSLYGKPREF